MWVLLRTSVRRAGASESAATRLTRWQTWIFRRQHPPSTTRWAARRPSGGWSTTSTRGSPRTRCCAPLYPEADLAGAEERLRMFLVQYWGGPRTYSEQRGHPRLRMRHAPFAIGIAERGRVAAAHARGRRLARPARRAPTSCSGTTWRWPRTAWSTSPDSWAADRTARQPVRQDQVREPPCDRPDPRRQSSGGAPPSSTRSTSAASPTATATASATSPASGPGCRTCATSASTRSGSRRSTRRRWPTAATTSPTTATSSRCSAPSPTPTR